MPQKGIKLTIGRGIEEIFIDDNEILLGDNDIIEIEKKISTKNKSLFILRKTKEIICKDENL